MRRKNQKDRPVQATAVSLSRLSLRPSADCYYVLNEDVWVEIFKRLPTQALCRFRCVCKGWNSIISSSFFINLHFTFNVSATPRSLKPYLNVAYSDRVYYHPSHERYTLLDDSAQQLLHFPFRAEEDGGHLKRFTFVDAIHGVVCISYSWSSEVASPSVNSTFLWNPSLHEYVALPRLNLSQDFNAIGFGYDSATNDFKVVMGVSPVEPYKVYSSRRGSWRRPRTKTSVEMEHLRGWTFDAQDLNSCFVNGTIHWLLATVDAQFSVLMFDCASEEFRRMDIPEIVSGSDWWIRLFEYAGKLSVLVNHLLLCVNLWVMEEHGVSTSWKKLYVIKPVFPGIELDAQGDQEQDYEWTSDSILPSHIVVNDPSYQKLAPYGPNNRWNKFHYLSQPRQITSDHVYNESMFLMDHPKVRSYTSQDIVSI